MEEKMRLNFVESTEGKYRKIVASGRLPEESGWLLHPGIRSIIEDSVGAHLLIDLSAVKGRSSIGSSVIQAEVIKHSSNSSTHRIAVLDLLQNIQSARDEELVLMNRGLSVRFFFDEASAIRWLSGHRSLLDGKY
jgi:hypothetical protein